ncbi:MAG: winged helix-turn-helix domain-containing protein [Candidatus Aenigmatarchaeota archaeon]
MSKDLELDKNSFEILSSDTKRNILKKLKERKMTVTELSKRLDLSKSTIHEHLSKLNEHGFVEKITEGDKKWVYYRLTGKSKSLLHNRVKDIIFLLSTGIITITGFYELRKHILLGMKTTREVAKPMIQDVGSKEILEKTAVHQTQTHLIIAIMLFVTAIALFLYYWKKVR